MSELVEENELPPLFAIKAHNKATGDCFFVQKSINTVFYNPPIGLFFEADEAREFIESIKNPQHNYSVVRVRRHLKISEDMLWENDVLSSDDFNRMLGEDGSCD